MAGDGGRWREMVGDGGRWREMAGDGGRWREMVGDGGRWWEMVGDGGGMDRETPSYWQGLHVADCADGSPVSHTDSPTPGDGVGDGGRWWEMAGDGVRWRGMVGVWTGRHPRIGKAYMSPTVPTGRQ